MPTNIISLDISENGFSVVNTWLPFLSIVPFVHWLLSVIGVIELSIYLCHHNKSFSWKLLLLDLIEIYRLYPELSNQKIFQRNGIIHMDTGVDVYINVSMYFYLYTSTSLYVECGNITSKINILSPVTDSYVIGHKKIPLI